MPGMFLQERSQCYSLDERHRPLRISQWGTTVDVISTLYTSEWITDEDSTLTTMLYWLSRYLAKCVSSQWRNWFTTVYGSLLSLWTFPALSKRLSRHPATFSSTQGFCLAGSMIITRRELSVFLSVCLSVSSAGDSEFRPPTCTKAQRYILQIKTDLHDRTIRRNHNQLWNMRRSVIRNMVPKGTLILPSPHVFPRTDSVLTIDGLSWFAFTVETNWLARRD